VNYKDIFLTYLPLSHIAAQIVDVWIPMVAAATVCFADKDALKVSRRFKKYCESGNRSDLNRVLWWTTSEKCGQLSWLLFLACLKKSKRRWKKSEKVGQFLKGLWQVGKCKKSKYGLKKYEIIISYIIPLFVD
jgi:hypothetical protein